MLAEEPLDLLCTPAEKRKRWQIRSMRKTTTTATTAFSFSSKVFFFGFVLFEKMAARELADSINQSDWIFTPFSSRGRLIKIMKFRFRVRAADTPISKLESTNWAIFRSLFLSRFGVSEICRNGAFGRGEETLLFCLSIFYRGNWNGSRAHDSVASKQNSWRNLAQVIIYIDVVANKLQNGPINTLGFFRS